MCGEYVSGGNAHPNAELLSGPPLHITLDSFLEIPIIIQHVCSISVRRLYLETKPSQGSDKDVGEEVCKLEHKLTVTS